MEIPDCLSDMDSIPDTIGLNRDAGVGAVAASCYATAEDLRVIALPRLCAAIAGTTRAIRRLNEVLVASEVAELESLYNA